MTGHWTAADVARELNLATPGAARKLLSRWRREGNPAGRSIGRDPITDIKLYDPDLVRAAREAMPGHGVRRTTTASEE
jgi:hypothetical protein